MWVSLKQRRHRGSVAHLPSPETRPQATSGELDRPAVEAGAASGRDEPAAPSDGRGARGDPPPPSH